MISKLFSGYKKVCLQFRHVKNMECCKRKQITFNSLFRKAKAKIKKLKKFVPFQSFFLHICLYKHLYINITL